MANAAPHFVTDDEKEIAIRTDRIRTISLVVEDDETVGRVRFVDDPDPLQARVISEKQARQIIRRLVPGDLF